MGRSREGIGRSKGAYLTKENMRESNKKYKAKFDIIEIKVPKGTRDRLIATSLNRQELFNKLINDYIDSANGDDE